MAKVNINIWNDLESLSAAAAIEFARIANDAIRENGRFTVALSGGSTPVELYKLLSSEEFISKLDWEKIFFFFTDERDVSPASNQSNFKMVNELLFKPLKISKPQIFRWQTEIINAVGIAEQYEKYIRKFFKMPGEGIPSFDLCLLGLGDDGHTASLFPHTKALTETKALAVANIVKKLKVFRLTLTFPVINSAKNIWFLVSGDQKAKMVLNVLEGEYEPEKFPAQAVKPIDGKLSWFMDDPAAHLIKK